MDISVFRLANCDELVVADLLRQGVADELDIFFPSENSLASLLLRVKNYTIVDLLLVVEAAEYGDGMLV